jgi:uracil-DNA glycosylase
MERIQPQRPQKFNGLVLVGESPGKDEIEQGIPFVGRSGKLLDTVLAEVGITRDDCMITNVFLSRPEKDKIDKFFRPVAESDSDFINQYGLYRNWVVRDDNRIDMERLQAELIEYQPKLIVLLGATALWRLTKASGITGHRGEWILTLLPGISHMVGVLPTWHPSAVLRNRRDKLPEFVSDMKQVADVLAGIGT